MSDRPDGVSVLLVSWNGRHHLEECLPALAAQRDPGVPWEVLVLDNGSRDGTVRWLQEHWTGLDRPRVRLVESHRNLGFCAGNNRLVAEAAHDAVALLNNDTRPRPDWLAALVDALAGAPPDVAAVSGQIVDWEGDRLDFARGAVTFDGHAFQLDFRRPLERATVPPAGAELPFACGGNMLVRKRSFLEAGGFDEAYFAYLEDVDLGWRLWSGGERVIFTPEAVVHHRSSATSDLLGSFNRGFLFERNAFLTVYKNAEEELWRGLMPAVMLTLTHRSQFLMIHANPGGGSFALDPYAGHIADTEETTPAGVEAAAARAHGTDPDSLAVRWLRRVRELGPREALRRAWERFRSPPAAAGAPVVRDERTLAQLRAQSFLLRHLDEAAADRRRVQQRRRRSDAEWLERFPLYLVPTYPGDEELFTSSGFEAWLPRGVPLRRRRLDEIMELGEE